MSAAPEKTYSMSGFRNSVMPEQKPRLHHESTGSLPETSVIVNQSDRAYMSCALTGDRVTACITPSLGESAYCFCAEAISADSL